MSDNPVRTLARPVTKEDGTIQVAGFELPLSKFLDAKTRDALLRWNICGEEMAQSCLGHWTEEAHVPTLRNVFERCLYSPAIARSRALFNVRIEPGEMSSVYTETIVPDEGCDAKNRDRVLINLHGGGFVVGGRMGGLLESIPVAAVGKIKVVSVDYRMAPEFEFPAATDDAVAVYRQLLAEHDSRNIGLFGCSAGGILTAQTLVRLQQEDLPLPGAAGMFFATGSFWAQGDSAHLGAVLMGEAVKPLNEYPYFKKSSVGDPLVFPVNSPQLLSKFPPSLLMTATRDWVMSSVVHMHSRLIACGVQADLHVWEGLGHAFFYNPDLPQSREAHEVAVGFFDRHLGRSP